MFMRLGFNFYDVAVTIFCVAFGLLCFYPLWYCLVASVMPYEEYVKGGLMLWFKGIDLQYYIQIFRSIQTVCSSPPSRRFWRPRFPCWSPPPWPTPSARSISAA